MALIDLDPRDRTPIYAQLDRGLRAAIATGRLRLGDQLPTVRQLAVALQVNANTVARVYSELERTGVLETRRGVGSFVRATPTGLIGEFSFPLPAGETSFHLNLGWQDHDRPENTKPSVLWWRDESGNGFGEFTL